MNILWTKNIKIKEFPHLKENKNLDVLIIGAGMAGILCAYFMQKNNINYALVEGNRIGMGITKGTTAKITFQHGLIYNDLINNNSKEYALKYLDANKKALEKYKEICKDINCDFKIKSAFTYSLNNRKIIENEIKALNSLGYNSNFVSDLPLPFNIQGAIEFKNQASFNPLKFISEISNDLNIYENTFIEKIKGNIAYTKDFHIKAKKIIIATHFPFINSHGFYFIKMYQSRSYVIAVENNERIKDMYVDENQEGMSFRGYENLLLIGGGDHRTGKGGQCYKKLKNFIKKYYPDSKEKYWWATQDCMTLDNVPYIGQYSKFTPNLYVSTGFNKWGMTSSMVSAMILTDMILEKNNEYKEIFFFSISVFKPQLINNIGESFIIFIKPTTRRCPHLGCSLKWNKLEHTWDCPCHGSRFDEKGHLIDNPSIKDINL